jgi:hypothetical protein
MFSSSAKAMGIRLGSSLIGLESPVSIVYSIKSKREQPMEEKVEWFRYTWSIYIIKQLKIALNKNRKK